MTLYELLRLISLTTPFFCSFAVGWKEGRGFGIFLGLIVGLVLAVGCFWGTRPICRWIVRHPKLENRNPTLAWRAASLFMFAIWFALISGFSFFGMWFTKFAIHHVAA
jgi:hypothetical protein